MVRGCEDSNDLSYINGTLKIDKLPNRNGQQLRCEGNINSFIFLYFR